MFGLRGGGRRGFENEGKGRLARRRAGGASPSCAPPSQKAPCPPPGRRRRGSSAPRACVATRRPCARGSRRSRGGGGARARDAGGAHDDAEGAAAELDAELERVVADLPVVHLPHLHAAAPCVAPENHRVDDGKRRRARAFRGDFGARARFLRTVCTPFDARRGRVLRKNRLPRSSEHAQIVLSTPSRMIVPRSCCLGLSASQHHTNARPEFSAWMKPEVLVAKCSADPLGRVIPRARNSRLAAPLKKKESSIAVSFS